MGGSIRRPKDWAFCAPGRLSSQTPRQAARPRAEKAGTAAQSRPGLKVPQAAGCVFQTRKPVRETQTCPRPRGQAGNTPQARSAHRRCRRRLLPWRGVPTHLTDAEPEAAGGPECSLTRRGRAGDRTPRGRGGVAGGGGFTCRIPRGPSRRPAAGTSPAPCRSPAVASGSGNCSPARHGCPGSGDRGTHLCSG